VKNDSVPRPEHPRPDFRRDNWFNLNGVWAFRYDPDDVGEAQQWQRHGNAQYDQNIIVPFPWQSELSGQHNPDYRGVAWYRRTFVIPPVWREQRVFLCFGAVDYWASVWVNGHLVGQHEGGYTPFVCDITDVSNEGENTVVVRVHDPADLREIPHGKQKSIPADAWQSCEFTPTSGIWQTVWLELRSPCHFTSVRITPDVDAQCAHFTLSVHGGITQRDVSIWVSVQPPTGDALSAHASISLTAGETATVAFAVSIPDLQLWDLDTPNLYHVTLALQPSGQPQDVVCTYFGMRKVTARDGKLWLNDRPVYLISALDQGFWPDGIHTAPSDEALRADIEFAKRAGLNALRKHIKIEDPRFIYWADVLGLLLWCDVPSPTDFTDLACRRLAREMEAMIERDYNHPSIIIWCPYNESWGFEFRLAVNTAMQEWLAALYERAKKLDPTRLTVDNSGWSHVRTDIADFHYYTDYEAEWRSVVTLLAHEPDEATVLGHPLFAQGHFWQGEPLIMSEYGAGWKDDRSWHLHWQTNELRRHGEIAGYTYTELYDIEHERAGYALYDRTPKDFGYDLAMINSEDFVVLDYRGPHTLWPGEALRVSVYASLYGLPLHEGILHWQVHDVVSASEDSMPLAHGSCVVQLAPYAVTRLPEIEVSVPAQHGPLQLWAWLEDSAGNVRARNYLNFEVFRSPLAREEQHTESAGTTFVLRFRPGDYIRSDWDVETYAASSSDSLGCEIFWARTSGFVEYCVPLPPGALGRLSGLALLFEAGSHPPEIAQSVVGHRQPSDLTVSINGIEISTTTLPNLHVNSLGVLTRLNNLGPGEHGDPVDIYVPEKQLAAVKAAMRNQCALFIRLEVKADAAQAGGLTLFGARSGRYGREPTIILTVAAS
jgi:hypothetical protein